MIGKLKDWLINKEVNNFMPTAQEVAQAKVAEAQAALVEAQRQLANLDSKVDYDVDDLERGMVVVQSDPTAYIYAFDLRNGNKPVFMSGKGNVGEGTVEKGLDPDGGTFIEKATMLTKDEIKQVVQFARHLVQDRL